MTETRFDHGANASDLAEQLRVLESLIGHVGGGIVLASPEGRFLHFGEHAQRILGRGPVEHPPGEWPAHYGIHVSENGVLAPWEELPLVRAMRGEEVDAGDWFFKNVAHPEGIWCRVTAAPLRDGDGRVLGGLAFFWDVTERVRSERKLRESGERMRSIVETARDAIVTIDAQGTVSFFNPAAEAMFGYAADEVVGRNVSLLMPADVANEHDGYLQRYIETGEAHIIGVGREVVARRKDGSTFPAALSVGAFDTERFTGFLRDLTEEKQREAEYMQAQKMEAVGRLAGGVAHDFNNLLTGVLSGLRIAAKKLDPGHPAAAMIRTVDQEAERGAAITRRLLDFSRTEQPDPRPIPPCETVRGAERMLRRLLGEDIEMHLSCHAADALVVADPGRVEQALLNLAINSRDAMPRGGTLRIECARVSLSAGEARALGGVAPGPYVVIAVQDTGTGMDEETRRKATEAFFTTKPSGVGTGLGLASVAALMVESGGVLALDSEPGLGTTVRLFFPLAEATRVEAASEVPVATEGARARDGQTVLVVEDETLVRLGIQHLLEELGYAVVATKDSGEALEELDDRAASIDLLLTDVVLPGLSGPELAATVRQRWPALPVLFMSAFPAEELVRQGRIEPGTATLAKPFTTGDVAAKVQAALRASPLPPA